MRLNATHLQKDRNQIPTTTPIAIIGIASIFPDAPTTSKYWENILNKIDTIIDVPSSRWNVDEYYDPDPSAADKSYCKRGAFIPDVEFDPTEFGLPPNMLEATDVSQLLSLVVAKECLKDGGYDEVQPSLHERTGVILGMVGINSKLAIPLMSRLQYPIWEKVLLSYGISPSDTQNIIQKIQLAYPKWEENSFPGSIGNVIAGRIANRLDLGGINCVVDAACGSSLAAVRMAVSELIEGRADMMITGGVDTDNSIGTYMCFSKTPAFSKSDNVRPFDQDSDGMMVGEGIGMLLLKRLEDAKNDGDRVYAVIKGIGTSSDGRYKSIYAPSASGQAAALRRTYIEAGFTPSTVGLIEAHGTGTMAGDPAEFQGLNEVFSSDNPRKQYIALGSVKSQIGHTKAAAGAASLIKTALALYHKVLPPTINITRPNSALDIEATPFYLNTESRPWIKPALYPRRAGVSAFGFGGTNFHVALEENENDHSNAYRKHESARIILVSAPSPAELLQRCRSLFDRMQKVQSVQNFSELVNEFQTDEIPQDDARIGFTAIDAKEACNQLSSAIDMLATMGSAENTEHPSGIYYRKHSLDPKGKIVALFPGQGSQYVNMGCELAIDYPPIRQAFADMDVLFDANEHSTLSEVVFPIPAFNSTSSDNQNQQLLRTEYAQPAIGTFSLGLYKLLAQAGFEADFIAGHSFGELTALWAAGVMDDDAFLMLAKARGSAMAPPDDPEFDAGTMLAVKGDIDTLQEELHAYPDITLANHNSNNQVVLAGSSQAVAVIEKVLQEKGYAVKQLPVSAAFHTALVAHAHQPFGEVIKKVKFHKPKTSVYSNTTGYEYCSDPVLIRQTLIDHVLKPVLFKAEIEDIYAKGGSIFIEFGPKNVLTNLVNNILEGKPHTALALNATSKKDSRRQLQDSIAHLCVIGLDLRGFDRYALPQTRKPVRKKSSASLFLNGGLYLTEKTRSAFEKAISEQNRLTTVPAYLKPNDPISASIPEKEICNPNHAAIMDQFQAFQNEALQVHQRFLANDQEYISGYTKMAQQMLDLLNRNSPQPVLEQIQSTIQMMERSMSQFHQHQAETLRMHERYVQFQEELVHHFMQIADLPGKKGELETKPIDSYESSSDLPQTTTVVEEDDIPTKKSEGQRLPDEPSIGQLTTQPEQSHPQISVEENDLKNTLLDIVSEKTGYPSEMLELEMDLESDLGIDSIKRVEILGAIQSHFPEFPIDDTASIAEMRTLGEIGEFLETFASSNASTGKMDDLTFETAELSSIAVDEAKQVLLDIVSEKTGYPGEMLELEMDLESDLGIDSIKRVEILGAIQNRYPELPIDDTSSIAEMRTLGEIVAYLDIFIGSTAPVNEMEPMEPGVVEFETEQTTVSLADISQTFLEIVSEKTGYPSEMLELDMDLEADLGIDSIKRVEILGGMQAIYPEIAKIDAADLAVLQTLRQIVDKMMATNPNIEPLEEAVSISAEISAPNTAEINRGVVGLKLLSTPDFQDYSLAEGHICLIVDDGTDLTIELSDRLTSEGKKAVVMQLPNELISQRNLPEHIPGARLSDLSEIGLQKILDEIQRDFGPAALFIHLDPAMRASENFTEKERSIIKCIFLIAKFLKETLNQAALDGFAGFITVTRMDGQFGLAPSGTVEPMSGALSGLVKTLNLEWEQVYCRAIDLEPELDARTAADRIVSELHDPNRLLRETSYHAGERFTLIVDQPEVEAIQGETSLIHPNSVILASGGARGITAKCVVRLAQVAPCNFILLGRTNITQTLPEWSKNGSNESELKQFIMDDLLEKGQKPTPRMVDQKFRSIQAQREVEATLDEIRRTGAAAEYIEADITQPFEELESLLAEPIQRMGKISGIIHGAGSLADKLIEKKTSIDFDKVFSPKMSGLQNLLMAAPINQLDFLILFSSVAGFFGNAGQTDYAMANEGLNKAAYQIKRENPACRVLSINWGPWDSGMVTPELQRAFEKRKMTVISSEAGVNLMVSEITTNSRGNHQPVQIVVGTHPAPPTSDLSSPAQQYKISRHLSLEQNPFLLDHKIGSNPVLPATCAASWLTSTCEQLYPGFTCQRIEDFKVLKGIVFDDTLADEYFLDLEEIEKTAHEEVKLFGRVCSKNNKGRVLYHYSLYATLLSRTAEPPLHKLPEELFKKQNNGIPGEQLYQDGTLFHGPTFQGVRRVLSISDSHVAMECYLPKINQKQQGQFPIQNSNPYINDVIVQSLLIWTQQKYQSPCLPSHLASLEYYREIPFAETCMVDLRILSHTKYDVVADIWVTDRNGNVYVKFNGLQGTISPSLKRLLGVSVSESKSESNDG